MYKSGGLKRDRNERDRDRGVDRERESPTTMTKRSRSSLGRYDMAGDSSDGGLNSPPPPRRRSPIAARSRYQDDYRATSGSSYKQPPEIGGGSSRPYPYKVLCISSLHPKASDEVVRETLYREFKRFGDISVKIVNEPDERVAYVYFRTYEDARDAKHSKSRIIIYDKPVVVEAAYESTSAPSSSYPSEPRPPRHSPHHTTSSIGGGGHDSYSDKYYNRRTSPMYEPRREDHVGGGGGRYARGGGDDRYHHVPAPPPPHHGHYPMTRGHHDSYDRGGHTRGRMGGGGEPMMHHDNYMGGGGRPPPPHYQRQRYPPSGPMGAGGGGMRDVHHAGGAPGQPRQPYENKKDKFPNYLHHVNPEDDPLATKTLFAGNLEVNITDEELRRIFGRYGCVEDIDIKRPPPGTGNAYAFVRFVNLDMASRAKTELSGQYIGKFQCKIGYGKVNPTTKIWIGGLGPWTTMASLEREFDRFGSIKKIDWIKNDTYAYITFETIEAAQAAVKDMRGYPLGGPDKRLRTDFADASSPPLGPEYPQVPAVVPTGPQPGAGGKYYDSYDADYNDISRQPYTRGGPPGNNSGGGGHANAAGNVPYNRGNREEGAVAESQNSTDLGSSPSDTEIGGEDGSRARRNGTTTGNGLLSNYL